MRKYFQFIIVFLTIIFSGFQCEKDPLTILNIVEGRVISCANSEINEVIVVHKGFENLIAVDTLFPGVNGQFLHQFSSNSPTYYLLPSSPECSSVWVQIPHGKKSEMVLRQTPLFEALNIDIELNPASVDSMRLRILGVNSIVNNDGTIVYTDPQNFDSGYTSQWDTLPASFILGQERSYNFITEIFSKGGSFTLRNETIVIQNQSISKTISL